MRKINGILIDNMKRSYGVSIKNIKSIIGNIVDGNFLLTTDIYPSGFQFILEHASGSSNNAILPADSGWNTFPSDQTLTPGDTIDLTFNGTKWEITV